MFSVVIPAHNEGEVIARCLQLIAPDLIPQGVEIIVVCNGCSDNTAEIARRFAGVQVYELEAASKVKALNLAEQHTSLFPRIFLDSDLIVGAQDLIAMAKHIDSGALVVAPPMVIDDKKSSWIVQAYHRIWKQLPYYRSRLGGVFALSKVARERFDNFPDIIADDAFVRGHFSNDERLVPDDCSFIAVAPRTLSDLVKIKTRSRFGNVELQQKFPGVKSSSDNDIGALLTLLLSKPYLIVSALAYVYVKIKIRQGVKARLQSNDYKTWERDNSSRVG